MAHSLEILKNLRLLHVTDGIPQECWLKNALREFPELKIHVEEVAGAYEGVKSLQTVAFNAVVVSLRPVSVSLDFIVGCRTGGISTPILILGRKNDANMMTRCCESGGDGWLALENATVSDLLWQLALAMENFRNANQNVEYMKRFQQETEMETEEVWQFTSHYREMLGPREKNESEIFLKIREELTQMYQELLKNSILLTVGHTESAISVFCERLIRENVSAEMVYLIHLDALENLLQTHNGKNTLHWMNRANLLLGRVTVTLLKRYQQGETERNSFSSFMNFHSEL
ncbi:MAG: hypothetical protein Q4C70_11225 [Planctomycetia bacterium]|nr:hypothetical protein [Planctomycetia bacterium]